MRRKMLWAGAIGAVIVVAGLVVVTYPSGHRSDAQQSETKAAAPIANADLSGTGPGTLVSAVTMPGFSRTARGAMVRSARVVYRSTDGDTGAPTVVSGAVFTPTGTPPAGGWRVISYGHGTLGIDQPCAPSLSPTLLSNIDWVSKLVDDGYAVAMADYQGLGAAGIHPYLDARTAGRNMIDAVRALRHTFGDVSGRWAAVGGSQGGGAAWAAGEQAGTYAPDMLPVGVVALAPAADVVGLVDLAQQHKLTVDQISPWALIVETLARLHPDVNRDDYRRGLAAQKWDVLTACNGDKVHEHESVVARLQPGDIAPSTPQAADRLRGYLKAWALPQQRPTAPMSVAFGGKDEYIDPGWTRAAIRRACDLGGVVVSDFQPDKGHGDLEIAAQFDWLTDRFVGTPVSGGCAAQP